MDSLTSSAGANDFDVRMAEVGNSETDLPEYYRELKCNTLHLT